MGQEEVKAVARVLKSGWIGLGPKTAEFEKEFAKYIGVKYALAVNSGTAALHLALKVLGVEKKEVITTPMSFVSTNLAILYNQGISVFADIERDTLNINPEEIQKQISPMSKVIMVVHYGGHACQMDEILKLAKKRNLFVIEDAAHACGGEYKNRKLGSLGDLSCFSFHAVKNLATGDGGMITTNKKDFYERLKKLRWLGISKDTWSREDKERAGRLKRYTWYYNVEEVGYKCHFNDILAAIGLVQLKKLDKTNKRRQQICQIYNQAFKDINWLERPVEKEYAKSSRHNYVIKAPCRDKLNTYLMKKGISTGVHYIPNNHYQMFKNCRGKTPIADEVWTKVLTLPLYPDMKNREIEKVIGAIRAFSP